MTPYRRKDRNLYFSMIASLKEEQVRKVLEIGCCDKEAIFALKQTFRDAEIHGIDCEGWDGKYPKQHRLASLEFLDLNKSDLPFAAESLDIVSCNQVLEHIYEVDHALDEIHRVLRKGGHFVCGTPNLAALHERLSLLFGLNPTTFHTANIQLGVGYPKSTNNRTHCNGFTVKGLKRLLRYHGFTPLRYATTEVYIGVSVYIPLLARLFKNLALSQCWIARK